MSNIVSPCISVCKTDPYTGYCYGCGRTNEEKKIWKMDNTSDNWKNDNLKDILERLEGFQKKSFITSYDFKKQNGISPIKKQIQENIKNK